MDSAAWLICRRSRCSYLNLSVASRSRRRRPAAVAVATVAVAVQAGSLVVAGK